MKMILVMVLRAAGAVATIVMLAGMSHATPIVDLTGSDAAVSSLSSGIVSRAAANTSATSENSRSTNFYTLGITNWPAAAGSNCTLSGDCRTTTKVPEPQSLVLVGSGLLSMAGFIRRKLAR